MAREWLFRSRYVAYLEGEVERLREELHRWQDAVLSREGLPTIHPREMKPLPQVKGRPLPSQWKARLERIMEPKREKEARPEA